MDIQFTSGEVLTAQKLNDVVSGITDLEGTVEGKYEKPASGIGASDLDASVNEALNKAGSAYQKPTSGISSGDLDASVNESINKANTAYQKPTNGISSGDLDASVNEALNKAGSAYQKPTSGISSGDLDASVNGSLLKAESAYQKPEDGISKEDLDSSVQAQLDSKVRICVTWEDEYTGEETSEYIDVLGQTPEVTIKNSLATNVSTDNDSSVMGAGGRYVANLSTPEGYYPEAQLLIGTADYTSKYYTLSTESPYNTGKIDIDEVGRNIQITAYAHEKRVEIVSSFQAGSESDNPSETALFASHYTANISVTDEGLRLDYCKVKMGNIDITDTSFTLTSPTAAVIDVPRVSDPLNITIRLCRQQRKVVNDLYNVTTDNTNKYVEYGQTYEETLTFADKAVKEIEVYYGFDDVTDTCYDSATGKIHIENFTKDLFVYASSRDTLPSDYHEVEWIGATKTQYSVLSETIAKPRFAYGTSASSARTSAITPYTMGQCNTSTYMQTASVFSTDASSNFYIGIFVRNGSDATANRSVVSPIYLNPYTSAEVTSILNAKKHIFMDSDCGVWVNGVYGNAYRAEGVEKETQTLLDMTKGPATISWFGIFGGANSATTVYNRARNTGEHIHYLKIWNGSGDLIHYYIPAYKDTSTEYEIGFYDIIGGGFLQNIGTGEYTMGGGSAETWNITLDTVLIQSSNQKKKTTKGTAYHTDLTKVLEDSTIVELKVMMGGTDITASAYSEGSIDIPSVTGDLVITAKAKLNDIPDLPEGYTRLVYLRSTGTQYIDTSTNLDASAGSYRIISELDSSTGVQAILGSRCEGQSTTPASQYGYVMELNAAGLLCTKISTVTTEVFTTEVTKKPYDVTVTLDGTNYTFDYDGQQHVTPYTISGTYDKSSLWMFAFRYSANGGSTFTKRCGMTGNIYYVVMKSGDTIQRKFVPAKRNSDNVLGMYDVVSNTFFTNKGTGTFVAGPAI